jgi:hypothetical protein
MGTVTLDDALRAKLNGLNESLELCSPDGKLVGYYVPDAVYRRFNDERAKAEAYLREIDPRNHADEADTPEVR